MDSDAWRRCLLALMPGLLLAAAATGNDSNLPPSVPALSADPYYESDAPAENAIDQEHDVFALASNTVVQPGPTNSCDCGCGSCCANVPMDSVCCGPLWTVRAGALFLRRTGGDDRVLSNGAAPIN